MKTINNDNWKTYWKEYWETVLKCVARLDGITEIHYMNGFIEFLDMDGKRISIGKKNKIKT